MELITTLNVCLGLMNKLIHVGNILVDNKIDILCLQEVEIPTNVASKNLSISGFNIELETNSEKSRTCIYISNNNKIPLDWLISSYVTYKVKCKNVFLT